MQKIDLSDNYRGGAMWVLILFYRGGQSFLGRGFLSLLLGSYLSPRPLYIMLIGFCFGLPTMVGCVFSFHGNTIWARRRKHVTCWRISIWLVFFFVCSNRTQWRPAGSHAQCLVCIFFFGYLPNRPSLHRFVAHCSDHVSSWKQPADRTSPATYLHFYALGDRHIFFLFVTWIL